MSLRKLLDTIRSRGAQRRSLTALAGPPGSGKSTLADTLVAELNGVEPGSAALVPMDGFHLDDNILTRRGLKLRKGSPETFDVAGLAHMLARLRANDEAEIFVPLFDRGLEISRAAASSVPQYSRHIIIEGNYLLLDSEPWTSLLGLFDTTVFINVPKETLRERLLTRWRGYGISEADAVAKVEQNDLVNAERIIAGSRPAEFVLN